MNLKHKYIVELIDYEIKEDELWLIMEYANYGDLFEFFKLLWNLQQEKILTLYYKVL